MGCCILSRLLVFLPTGGLGASATGRLGSENKLRIFLASASLERSARLEKASMVGCCFLGNDACLLDVAKAGILEFKSLSPSSSSFRNSSLLENSASLINSANLLWRSLCEISDMDASDAVVFGVTEVPDVLTPTVEMLE